jgi:L-alanine-DL-glutamate epimerase-like enolase superfamily enzyme
MNRRYFISALAASTITSATANASARSSPARRIRSAPVAIKSVALAPFEGRFHKFVAMNSYDKAPKGHTYPQTLVRIATDQGIEGVGVMGYAAPNAEFHQSLKRLIGANPLELYEMKDGLIVGRSPKFADILGRYRFLDGALMDLIGKLRGKPVWQLIGKSARDRVEVYDGTLYFSDVWFRDRGVRAVVEEAEEAQKKGYRGVKLKLGRGWRWMNKEEGLRRDIEVVRAVRKAVGPQMKLMADANNGYQKDPERAWRLLAETADANLYLIEEIFPEDVQQYTDLRAKMHGAGMKTLIADGENASNIALFKPFLEPRRLMDILQMDIRTGGLLDNLTLARMGEAAGAVSIPHNWGSQIGGLMGLHLAKAVPNVIAAEDDRSTCDLIVAEGYEFRDGTYSIPERPGLSIRVDEDVYQLKCKHGETLIN